MAGLNIEPVRAMTDALQALLYRASIVKASEGIEPPLLFSDFSSDINATVKGQYAVIETSIRNIFWDMLACYHIHRPTILHTSLESSGYRNCEPGLIFWLVEELLDSQTIDGCRRVFDYLESRRETIIAKNFKAKHLIILRSCNELLRRLSRAEDTVFCGRVFIFLFQSFPLGDKSSVNLRGEYHTENTTTFDEIAASAKSVVESMDIDEKDPPTAEGQVTGALQPATPKDTPHLTIDEAKHSSEEPLLDIDNLYPAFWTLQQDFSHPTRLFNADIFGKFKHGLDLTINSFQNVRKELEDRGATRLTDDNKRSAKRKRGEGDGDFASGFNPKYLTSRDLFELEIRDPAFRRHILVQALILIDFLLSLTPKSKEKFSDLGNKSVLYPYTLNADDTKWAVDTRAVVANYLRQGPEGNFYYRMVDTVLSRDKNWVMWKAEGCPAIERPSLSTQDFLAAKAIAHKTCTPRRLRDAPLGSLDLSFLSNTDSTTAMEQLKQPSRYRLPSLDSFEGPIAEDEFDISLAKTDEDKQLSLNSKASKSWRALRITAKSKLHIFDRVDDGQNIQVIFEREKVSEMNLTDLLETKGVGLPDNQLTEVAEKELTMPATSVTTSGVA
ncbi:MAG: hypothetical protein M1829_005879 [Trizodia sp. TS-e1964]|nr:MAG: hypothetical protein M1829_005879 [Trizodia sp. TS-e1964]